MRRGTSPATCSPATTALRCTRTGSPDGSTGLSTFPGCRRCGCTTCVTVRRRWPTPPGADLKTVQEQLGHTSIVLTADTYTSVLLDLHFKAAEATARLVLRAAARNPGQRYRSKIGPPKSAAPDQPTRPEPLRPKQSRKGKRAKRGRASTTHTRHTQINNP